MKLRNLVTVLGTAAFTAVLTLALAGLRGEGMAQAAPVVKPVIAQPKLTSQGCTFELKTDKATYEDGQSPVIEVTAVNPTDKPVKATVWVTVTTSSVPGRSRMLPMPRTVWSHRFDFDLKGDEKTTIKATCDAKLGAGQDVRIILGDKASAVLTNVGVPQAGGPNGGGPNRPNGPSRR
jgi:hypothetical protein